jgi:L-rhamnose mutarotase
MMRVGMVIGIRPEKLAAYCELHSNIWPEVARLLADARLANFSIFHKDELLFGYFEYHGENLEAVARIDEQPVMREWFARTEPCQVPFATRGAGEWWARMEEIFHVD